MFRYKLRTLLIVLALSPPALAGTWVIFMEPPSLLTSICESVAFAVVALVGCVCGPAWIENLRSRMWS